MMCFHLNIITVSCLISMTMSDQSSKTHVSYSKQQIYRAGTPVSYSSHQIYRADCPAPCQHNQTRQLLANLGCRILKEYRTSIDILCHEDTDFANLDVAAIKAVQHLNIDLSNIAEDVKEEKRRIRSALPPPADARHYLPADQYHRYDDIHSYLLHLPTRHPATVNVTVLGLTHENRSILLVKVGRSSYCASTSSVLVDGGMHAREWVTVATALRQVDYLVKLFAKEGDLTDEEKVLTAVDWYLIPLLNPDGYEFSHTDDRFWRKNRRPAPVGGGNCLGVDINRNFKIGYGLGADTNACGECYQGPGPMSEPETAALVNILEKINQTLLYYVSLHAYGQSWLTPWGYKTEEVDKFQLMKEVATNAFQEIVCNYGEDVPSREYEVGGAADIYYIAGGASDDFVYTYSRADAAFTIELPDDGRQFGFLLPPQKVPQVAQDIWTALRSLTVQMVARLVHR